MIDLKSETVAATATTSVVEMLERVTNRIAPMWPLDQFIAVNPYWGFRDQPIAETARQLRALSGSPLLMPRKFYQKQLASGAIRREHLLDVLSAENSPYSVDDLMNHVHRSETVSFQLPLITDLVDRRRDLLHGMSVHDFVIHNVSQHCAAYFDQCQALWRPFHGGGLYPDWLRHAAADYSPRLLMGIKGIRTHASNLPDDPLDLIKSILDGMHLPERCWDQYLTALLLSINGWASWCANQRWQANLAAEHDDSIVHLLAIRLAWEWLLLNGQYADQIDPDWFRPWVEGNVFSSPGDDELDWLLQGALERAYQQPICVGLAKPSVPVATHSVRRAVVQAVFCIDVRSEIFRRALEASSLEVQTLGFAGFFGMPISYAPLGTQMSRPQLPGLLAPSLCVTEQSESVQMDQTLARRRRARLELARVWKTFRASASSTFSFVESFGLPYAGKLLKASLPTHMTARRADQEGLSLEERSHLRPRIQNMSLPQQCDLAGSVLKGMSLTKDFARIVLLVGHGSQSANNAHSSGLDCGACCGQTGEVNARALAALLNQVEVRSGLVERRIVIPDEAFFLAAMHNTTTDEIELFDTDLLPPTHAADVERVTLWLSAAGDRARAERTESLGLKPTSPRSLKKALRVRANDWSQVRPEWGLANNASFIIAPRSRTRHFDLKGRAFLHEYDAAQDPDFSTLETIMTAPMLVTNWINTQYYASTVDNLAYGSGNKVLHNVVGGRLGVFEGNGGDLRIGLPLQSLQDGEHLRHIPLRLSVFVEAPRWAIAAIVDKHRVVKDLVDHAWLHLFQVEPAGRSVCRYSQGVWRTEIPTTHPHSGLDLEEER